MKNRRNRFSFRLYVFFLLPAASLLFCGRDFVPEETPVRFAVEHLSSAALAGREAGFPGEKNTCLWISDQYKKAGLLPPWKGSFFSSYVQEFPLPGVPQQKSRNALLLKSREKSSSIPALPVPLRLAFQAEAEAVFAGHCIHAPKKGFDDLKGIETAGKIVFCLRYSPEGKDSRKFYPEMSFEHKLKSLTEKKASGIVFIGDGVNSPPDIKRFSFPEKTGIPSIFIKQQDAFRIIPALKVRTEHYRKTGKITAGLDGVQAEVQYSITRKRVTSCNTGAFLHPYEKGQKIIAVGAHHDHLGEIRDGKNHKIYHGADDNASGTASVLRIGYLLSKTKHQKNTEKSSHNVLFMTFGAEEAGLLGSEYFLKNSKDSEFLESIAFMINLDMVGRLNKKEGLHIQGKDSADSTLEEYLKQALKPLYEKEFPVRFVPGGEGPSDHTGFYRNKVPTAFFFTGYHKDYHEPSDTSEKINYDGILLVSDAAAELTQQMIDGRIPNYREAPGRKWNLYRQYKSRKE